MPDLLTITYSFVNGTNADAAQVNQNFTDVKNYIDARLGNATSGQILVASAAAVLTPRTVSGDASISNTGVVTIANDAINAAKIAANAVGSSEIAADAVGSSEIAADAVGQSELDIQPTETPQTTSTIALSDSAWTTVVNGGSYPTGRYMIIGTVVANVPGSAGENCLEGGLLVAGSDSNCLASSYVKDAPSDRQGHVTVQSYADLSGSQNISLRARKLLSNTMHSIGNLNGSNGIWGHSRLTVIPIG